MESLSPESSSGTTTPVAGDEEIPETPASASSPGTDSHAQLPTADVDDEGTTVRSQEDGDQVKEGPNYKDKLKRLLKGKEKEWTAVAEKKGPLRLLDLPVDILREIINQVSVRANVLRSASLSDNVLKLPHTNDLTSLALCHSALHCLTIPCIYSRFDIVWPDASTHTEPRSGVDALTYGLATLVMAEEIFGEAPFQRRQQRGARLGSTTTVSEGPAASVPQSHVPPEHMPLKRRRRGNYYAQYTKKFSLGNGPPDWVQEYLITKEGGKMLGTLVALAVARMRNLETFVWDMPTGVLRDVWLALSSLAERDDGHDCRLDRIWVRWHDNSQMDLSAPAPPPPPLPLSNVPPPHPPHVSGAGLPHAPIVIPAQPPMPSPLAVDRVEHPTFSVLPALKSISVLDIDELPYLDEISVLIGRSQRRLRELRIGIARHAQSRDWVTAWEGDGVQQVDYNTTWTAASSIGEKRLGGVLGVLVGRVYNMRRNLDALAKARSAIQQLDRAPEVEQTLAKQESTPLPLAQSFLTAEPASQPALLPSSVEQPQPLDQSNPLEQLNSLEQAPASSHATPLPMPTGYLADLIELESNAQSTSTLPISSLASQIPSPALPHRPPPTRTPQAPEYDDNKYGPHLNGVLRLETLELERVPLSVSVLQKAFDWSKLTSLTLLHCQNHEQLWKALRRAYSPKSTSTSRGGAALRSPSKVHKSDGASRADYLLNLKRIHTNAVSPSLISFLKEALAPNSLEILFLQEGRTYSSSVTIDQIYRGPIRRHRGSLRKLMIDSSDKAPDGLVTSSSRWRRWMLNREILNFITSGRMDRLRELSVSIDYRDWVIIASSLVCLPR